MKCKKLKFEQIHPKIYFGYWEYFLILNLIKGFKTTMSLPIKLKTTKNIKISKFKYSIISYETHMSI